MNINALQKALLSWFKKEQRELPWRQTYDPYSVWISEVMLQQTQVKTMLPFYERWMRGLKDVRSVAEAEEDYILKLWEGLGYYHRAKNLKKAAKLMVENHGAQVPNSYEDLLSLPGFGPYTAAAVASIAFQMDKAVVDGNVTRVLSRLTNHTEDVKADSSHFWSLAQDFLPKGQAREFNQGLMELGALICLPRKPLCNECPLQAHCQARMNGLQEEIPAKRLPKKIEKIQVAVAILEKKGLVYIQKRPENGLMPGLWEFPGGKVKPGESLERALRREIHEELGLKLGAVQPFLSVKHAYTRFQVDLRSFRVKAEGANPKLKAAVEGKWVKPKELVNYAFPAANKRLIEGLIIEK